MAIQNQLPMRGKDIETRPIYVEEWLDSLPYIDFVSSIKLLQEALQACNTVPMKSAQRMELVTLFHRPYKYYLDTQIRAGAQHTLQSMEVMQSQLPGMKQLAVQLARASRLAVDEAFSHKSLWGQNKYPLQEMLMVITYLSHVLIYSCLEYSPTPQKIWQELNFLYQFAENINQHRTPVKMIETARNNTATSIEQRYLWILLVGLADPYHLPFGAIWEIYKQLHSWGEHIEIKPFQPQSNPSGYFVINLSSDSSPTPYSKFNLANLGQQHRLLDTTRLQNVIQDQLDNLETSKGKDTGLVFSSYYADYLLRMVDKAWGLPPKRNFPRNPKTGRLDVLHGMNSLFYHLNGEQEFKAAAGEEEFYTSTPVTANSVVRYPRESWGLVDVSGGGMAITRDTKPSGGVRVGDIVGICLDEKIPLAESLRVGILRWLVVRQGKIYKMGLEMISQMIFPAGLRATNGSVMELEFRRAILIGNPAKQSDFSIITSKGLYAPGRELEIRFRDQVYKGTVSCLVEYTTCFEQFNCKLQ